MVHQKVWFVFCCYCCFHCTRMLGLNSMPVPFKSHSWHCSRYFMWYQGSSSDWPCANQESVQPQKAWFYFSPFYISFLSHNSTVDYFSSFHGSLRANKSSHEYESSVYDVIFFINKIIVILHLMHPILISLITRY